MTDHEGGCLCGRVRFRVSGPCSDSGYCHCRMCQRNSGAPVVAWVTFPAEAFVWTGGAPRTHASSTHGRREFCADCGSYIVFRSMDRPEEISVNTAALDEPEVFAPRKHIFAESRIAWFEVADDLPRYVGYGPTGEQQPPG